MVSPPNIYPLISTRYPYLGPSSMRAHAPRWGRSVFCCRLLLSGSAPDSPLSWALRPPRTHPQINPSGPTPRLPDVQRCAETGRGPQPRTGFCMRLHIRVAVCGRGTRWRVASPLMWLALWKSAQSRSRLGRAGTPARPPRGSGTTPALCPPGRPPRDRPTSSSSGSRRPRVCHRRNPPA